MGIEDTLTAILSEIGLLKARLDLIEQNLTDIREVVDVIFEETQTEKTLKDRQDKEKRIKDSMTEKESYKEFMGNEKLS